MLSQKKDIFSFVWVDDRCVFRRAAAVFSVEVELTRIVSQAPIS